MKKKDFLKIINNFLLKIWFFLLSFATFDQPYTVLCEKCPCSEFFWSAFSPFGLKYSPYSVRMQEYTDQKNSEYGQFSRSAMNDCFTTKMTSIWRDFDHFHNPHKCVCEKLNNTFLQILSSTYIYCKYSIKSRLIISTSRKQYQEKKQYQRSNIKKT